MTPQVPLTGRRNAPMSITGRSRMSGIIQDTESRIRGEDDMGELNDDDFNLESLDPSAHNTLDSNRNQNQVDFSDGYRYKPKHQTLQTGRSLQVNRLQNIGGSIDEDEDEREGSFDAGTF